MGDSAGYVDVPSLKGVHYAMQSGIYAARAIFAGLKKGDTSAAALAESGDAGAALGMTYDLSGTSFQRSGTALITYDAVERIDIVARSNGKPVSGLTVPASLIWRVTLPLRSYR